MSKKRFSNVRSIRNRWLRGLAAWSLMAVAVVVLFVMVVVAMIVDIAVAAWEGVAGRCEEIWSEIIRPSLDLLAFSPVDEEPTP